MSEFRDGSRKERSRKRGWKKHRNSRDKIALSYLKDDNAILREEVRQLKAEKVVLLQEVTRLKMILQGHSIKS